MFRRCLQKTVFPKYCSWRANPAVKQRDPRNQREKTRFLSSREGHFTLSISILAWLGLDKDEKVDEKSTNKTTEHHNFHNDLLETIKLGVLAIKVTKKSLKQLTLK